MEPRVSVIMGIYNCEDTIEKAIQSVINQTYKNWELIMCDDGSTDETYNIANMYANKFKNIKVIRNKKNMRLAYSLNRCLEVSTGKYIARMDADDESLPERLKIQVNFLENNQEYKVVGSSAIIFDEDGVKGIRNFREYPFENDKWHGTPFAHPTIMMYSSTYKELGGYTVSKDTMRAEDLDLWFRFKLKGYQGYNIQNPLYKYRESIVDYKKRNLNAAIGTSKIIHKYYKLMNMSLKYYPRIIKPIIIALLPDRLIQAHHKKMDNNLLRDATKINVNELGEI